MFYIRKERARATLRAALLEMIEILRQEVGEHIDGVAADLTLAPGLQNSEGNLAALSGDLVFSQETL